MPPDEATYPANSWGPLAANPYADLAPNSPRWREAARRAWLHEGGSEEGFAQLVGPSE